MARVFRTAMSGRAKKHQELAETPIPLEAALATVPCRGDGTLVEDLFGPLGYEVETATDPEEEHLEEHPPTATCGCGRRRRSPNCRTTSYVLLPVADNRKHYWIGEAEVQRTAC